MIHLILEDLSFNDEFKDFITKENFTPEDGKVYQTLGIIGCQSSGKSTLLNYVFDTKFAVMDESEGRTQTTKGIWTAINKEFNVLLFDVEGTDSKERGDDRFKFEQCSTLFTLAMSDVLMINMWTSDIGRYTASNYGVLKVVFELNLKLFQQESAKKVIVILRDYNEEENDLGKLKSSIMEDMRQIWSEIPKPENFGNKNFDQFFQFEFLTLAHLFYQKEKFNEGINQIKKRLKREKNDRKTGANVDSLFNLVDYDKNVPVDGLYKYAQDIWNCILNDKDLNIPGQKEMLSLFKCEEIKNEALGEVESDINNLEILSSAQTLKDFTDRVQQISTKAFDIYDSKAKFYLKHVYLDVRKKLNNDLANKMYSSFANQLKRLIPKYQKDFRVEFANKLKTDENFYKVSEELKKKYLEIFEEKIMKLKIFDSWEIGKDNEALLDEVIEDQKRICLEERKERILEKFKDVIDDTVANKFELINQNFWEEFEQEIFQLISGNLLAQKDFLIDTYKMTNDEVKPFLIECEDEVHKSIKSEILRQLPNFPKIQIENFKKDFWYDDGIPREWNKVTVGFMNDLYYKICDKYKNTFELLKELKVIPHLLELCNYEKTSEEEIENIIGSKIGEILKDPNMKFESLLSEEQLKGYLDHYEDGINDIFDDAKRRHDNIKQTSIPLWAWLLLIYVGYDDIWKMFTGYWLLFLLLLVGLYATLNMLGLGNAPKMVFNMIQNQIQNIIRKR